MWRARASPSATRIRVRSACSRARRPTCSRRAAVSTPGPRATRRPPTCAISSPFSALRTWSSSTPRDWLSASRARPHRWRKRVKRSRIWSPPSPEETLMTVRKIQQVIPGMPASDGAGVKLIRSLGAANHLRADPFLMLDAFSSENPDDYVAGFPSHPHRGFETVTYLLDGHMLHEDHLGNRGNLKSGGVQWMTAGRGIVHSEMPQQENGRMRGFQLWINLPAKEKMKPAGYRDIQPSEIPTVKIDGGEVKVVAGRFRGTTGPAQGGATDPTYWDVSLSQGKTFSEEFKSD